MYLEMEILYFFLVKFKRLRLILKNKNKALLFKILHFEGQSFEKVKVKIRFIDI